MPSPRGRGGLNAIGRRRAAYLSAVEVGLQFRDEGGVPFPCGGLRKRMHIGSICTWRGTVSQGQHFIRTVVTHPQDTRAKFAPLRLATSWRA